MNINMNLVENPNGSIVSYGYAVVEVEPGTVPDHPVHKGQLVPRLIKKELYDRVKNALDDVGINNVYLNRNAHGPALTTNIDRGDGKYDISLDKTLSIPTDMPVTMYGWPRPDTLKAYPHDVIEKVKAAGMHLVPKDDIFWAISASKAEKTLLSEIDKGNGCRREVLRIMKKELEICRSRSDNNLPGMSSHLIKNLVLWASEQHSNPDSWRHGNLANCLIDTTDSLIKAFSKGKCPYYFNTSDNVLKGKDRAVLRKVAEHFKVLRQRLIHM